MDVIEKGVAKAAEKFGTHVGISTDFAVLGGTWPSRANIARAHDARFRSCGLHNDRIAMVSPLVARLAEE